MLIDTHCHFDVEEFDADRDAVAARTLAAGVDTVVVPGYVAAHWPRLFAVCAGCAAPRLLPVPGLHPCYVETHREADLATLEQLLAQHPEVVAVGEIGLDFFLAELKGEVLRRKQEAFFRAQLRIAAAAGKPVLLHVRKAHADVLRVLREERFREGGIVHAWSGGIEEARHYVRLGFHLGIGGPLTYDQSRRLREVVSAMPLECLVLETDAPDMTPQPHRVPGESRTRNSPEFLPAVAQALATLRGLPLAEVAAATRRESLRALRLSA
ncbi:MAG TPA: TatD family hydrolase [Moraxellaceae bacterium]|nr:TatD family hydrolase [Moraxellaceae bacterium]